MISQLKARPSEKVSDGLAFSDTKLLHRLAHHAHDERHGPDPAGLHHGAHDGGDRAHDGHRRHHPRRAAGRGPRLGACRGRAGRGRRLHDIGDYTDDDLRRGIQGMIDNPHPVESDYEDILAQEEEMARQRAEKVALGHEGDDLEDKITAQTLIKFLEYEEAYTKDPETAKRIRTFLTLILTFLTLLL